MKFQHSITVQSKGCYHFTFPQSWAHPDSLLGSPCTGGVVELPFSDGLVRMIKEIFFGKFRHLKMTLQNIMKIIYHRLRIPIQITRSDINAVFYHHHIQHDNRIYLSDRFRDALETVPNSKDFVLLPKSKHGYYPTACFVLALVDFLNIDCQVRKPIDFTKDYRQYDRKSRQKMVRVVVDRVFYSTTTEQISDIDSTLLDLVINQ